MNHRSRSLGLVQLLASLVLLGLAVGTSRAADAAPIDNVVVLLDSSGSMNERIPGTRLDKMSAAKSALKEILRQLPPATHIGVLVFGGKDQRQDDWVYPLGPRQDGPLSAAIDRLRADGGTPLGAFIKRAADRLLAARASQLGYGSFRLLVVSDGEAQDKDLVDRYTPEIIARGITVDVIGVAMAKQHTLATKVHSYRAANDAESLRRALGEVLAEVGAAAGGGDVAAADAFALIAPIPGELASAALQALAGGGFQNQPIGVAPPRPTPVPSVAPPAASPDTASAPSPSASQSATSPTAASPTRPVPAPVPAPAPAPAPDTSTPPGIALRLPILGLMCFGFAFLFLLAIARNLAKRSRGRR